MRKDCDERIADRPNDAPCHLGFAKIEYRVNRRDDVVAPIQRRVKGAPRAEHAPDWTREDRPDTDGRFAAAIGAPFALVLTGVTARADLPVHPEPQIVGDDLASVVDQLLSHR